MHPNAEASVTQLSDFQNWLSAAKDEESSRNADWAGRSDSDRTLLSHLHSLLTSDEGQSSASTKKTELVRGDKVLARSGDFVGLTGTVAQVTGDEIKVALDDHLRTEGIPDELLFNISDLIKRFDIGDSVAVVHGKDVGSSGIVVAIDAETRVLTVSHASRNFKVRMEDCCNPAASIKPAGQAAPPKFKTKTLVECQSDSAPPTRGVVIECQGSSVTVLTASNVVITYDVAKVSEVKSSITSAARDCHGRPIRRGDTVKIMSGPNINPSVSGKYLRVEFIITTDLIVFSPSIESNRGFMAVKASLVETPGPPKVDPSMPAPFSGSGGHSGMQQQHPYSVDGMSIGSSVRIVKGVHKGKDGVVRKIMGNKMSVQVRGGQQVEVSSDMIKSDDPNSAGSFGFARSEGSQSQQSYRTPHIPFSPGHSLPTSSPAPASPAPSGWSHSGTGYGSSTIGSSRFGTPGSSVARSPAPFSGSSGMGSAWTSQSPAPNTPATPTYGKGMWLEGCRVRIADGFGVIVKFEGNGMIATVELDDGRSHRSVPISMLNNVPPKESNTGQRAFVIEGSGQGRIGKVDAVSGVDVLVIFEQTNAHEMLKMKNLTMFTPRD